MSSPDPSMAEFDAAVEHEFAHLGADCPISKHAILTAAETLVRAVIGEAEIEPCWAHNEESGSANSGSTELGGKYYLPCDDNEEKATRNQLRREQLARLTQVTEGGK